MSVVFALRWRVGLALLGGAGLFAPAAQASSFVTIAPPSAKVSSSFVVLGQEPPVPALEAAALRPAKPRSALDAPPDYAWDARPIRISASIVAFGTPAPKPAVETVKVASIGMPKPEAKAPAPRRRPAALPKVIRAGVKGHAFPDYVTPKPAAAKPPEPPPAEPTPDPSAPKPAATQPPPAPRDPEPPVALQ